MHYDLKILGGTIVDGTGKSGYAGDLGIKDGKVVALGKVDGEARETIDAKGRVVAPGFIDIHTHYDAQVTWDPMLAISPWHGVTTVIMGNCGFSIAPTPDHQRDLILRTLERVEGMSLESLRAGVGTEWPLATFPAYLEAIEKRGILINVGAHIGHTPLRLTVMGEEAVKRTATHDEMAAMARLVREAMEAGAMGFTTSMTRTQYVYDGHPTPSRLADWTEVEMLVAAMAAGSSNRKGIIHNSPGSIDAIETFSQLAGKYGVNYTWTALLAGLMGPGSHRQLLEESIRRRERGLPVYPQTSPQPQQFEFDFNAPIVFDRAELFAQTRTTDREGRLALYRDSEFRRAFKALKFDGLDSALANWTDRVVVTHVPGDASFSERRVAELAAEQGKEPIDLILDLSVEGNLHTRFRLDVLNFDHAEVAEIMRDPVGVLAFSDAGAHASQLCNVNYTTYLLQHWVRETKTLTLEQAVWMLTGRPAEVVGITDRGRLAVGLPADVVVFDKDKVGCGPLRRVNDLPTGAERVIADAFGIEAVIVNGKIVRRGDNSPYKPDDKLPGRLLRNGMAA